MINVILCGGSGYRLWPISREFYPKQFCNLNIIDRHSLFQTTLIRNSNLFDKTIIVTNENHYSLAKQQIDELSIQNIEFVLEPFGRNTAPSITIACSTLKDDDTVFVSPSDHFIKDNEKYDEAIEKARIFAEAGWLVTFGIKPASPETGYGYIETDSENVISFKEKPDKKTAERYIESEKYYWNSGMFVFKVKTFMEEIKYYSEEIFNTSQEAVKNAEHKSNIVKILRPYMEKIPSNSIDYAVMEKSKKIKMVVLNANWSDLGSFEAIHKISNSDPYGNVSSSKNIIFNSRNNLIISKNKPVVLIDVNDLIIVDTDDAILIRKNSSPYEIKELISELEKVSPNITKKHMDP